MPYLIDSNVFITAKNLHYGFDFCPAFWEWLVEKNRAGVVFSIEKVSYEIVEGDDDLSEWAEARGVGFFLPPDSRAMDALRRVSHWATGQKYEPAAISTFLQIADYYLVAQALAGNHTVVTHEKPAPLARRIKIPDACLGMGVSYVTPFEMLRRERARFVLGRTS